MDILRLYKFINENTVTSIFNEDEVMDEMAQITGDLGAAIRAAYEKHKDQPDNVVRAMIKSDSEVRNALQGQKLHDNQLNNFIKNARAGKEQRTRNVAKVYNAEPKTVKPSTDPNTNQGDDEYTWTAEQPSDEEEIKEMAQIAGDLDTAIRSVIDSNRNLSDSDLRRLIRRDLAVRDELERTGEKLHDNQLNRFIAKVKAGKPTVAPKAAEREWSEEEPDKDEIAAMVRKTMANKAGRAPSLGSGLKPAQLEDILTTLDAVEDNERAFEEIAKQLADDYELTPDEVKSIYRQEKSGEQGYDDESDIPEPTDKEDEYAPKLKIDLPEPSTQSASKAVFDKASILFSFKMGETEVLNKMRQWIDSRNDEREVDDPRGQHPLAGLSDEKAEQIFDDLRSNLKDVSKSGKSRLKSNLPAGAEYGEPGKARTDTSKEMEREMDIDYSSFQNFAQTFSEGIKTLKSTVITRYPQQIQFSEEFVNKLAEEFFNHNVVSEDRGTIRNLEEKMLKALRMHIHEIARQYREAQQQ